MSNIKRFPDVPGYRIVASHEQLGPNAFAARRQATDDDGMVLLVRLDDEAALARARLAVELEHPGLAASREIVTAGSENYFVDDPESGQSVATLLDAADQTLPSSHDVLVIAERVLGVLSHAHARGLVHGDLRPFDVLLLPAGRVRILRFGVAGNREASPTDDLVAVASCLRALASEPAAAALDATLYRDADAMRNAIAAILDNNARSIGKPLPGAGFEATHISRESDMPASRARSAQDLIGRQLGGFIVRNKIGAGGFGAVYRAEQPSLGREAIIKVPLAHAGTSSSLVQRFLREARVASVLDHPYAAHIYAFGSEPDGVLWIAMELVNGTPLDEYLRFQGAMPLVRALPFIERLAEVVHRAHELGLVHRDVKPSNVMVLARSGRLLPKLLDFGIARAIAETGPEMVATLAEPAISPSRAFDGKLTEQGSLIGSPLYMAPEQWVDAASVDRAADIYALGLLSYEILTGRAAFAAGSLLEVARAHASRSVPSLGEGFPAQVDAVLARATAKDPKARYAHAIDFAADLILASGIATANAPLPRLADHTRVMALARMPRPVAESIAALDATRTAHQACVAIREVGLVLASWLAIVALASRSRLGPPDGGDSPLALELLRELREHQLDATKWLVLARELVAPYRHLPELHPVPPLVALFSAPDGIRSLETLGAASAEVAEDRVRAALPKEVTALQQILEKLDWLGDYLVVRVRGTATESWMGTRGTGEAFVSLRGSPQSQHEVLLVDGDGVPLLSLEPLVRIKPPLPGAPDELFLLRGGPAGARLIASPSGFEHVDPTVWDWLRQEILTDSDTRPSQDTVRVDRAPYPGLAAFTGADADYFFGRERETVEFLNRLRVHALLVVVGRSGSGKSSFVQAGVIPALGDGWRPVVFRPGPSPLLALRDALARADFCVGDRDDQLGADLRRLAQDGSKLIIVVDQFEEVFTLCHDTEERQRFVVALTSAARAAADPIRVVITLRDDFLLATEELAAMRDRLGQALVLLTLPSAEDLERTITEPARRVDFRFDDPELPALMVREVADQPGGLPLLSFAAAELWQLRDRHFRRLLRSAYETMGGVAGALVRHAEAMVASMTEGEQQLLRAAFQRLVTADGTRAVIAKRELVQALGSGAAPRSVVEKLIASRLAVASEGADGQDLIEVAHETLLVAWPRLVGWRNEDREGARFRDHLRSAAKQWHDRGEPDGLLWRGEALEEYRIWRRRLTFGLTENEAAFADASIAAERRLLGRRRFAIGALVATMAVVAVILFALNQRAERAARSARDRLVKSYIEQARTTLQTARPWQSLANLVSLRELGVDGPAFEIMRGLGRESVRAMEFRIRADQARTWSVHFSPDGSQLVTTGEDGAALWDVSTGALHARLIGHEGAVRNAAFHPDGRSLVTVGFDTTVRIWDTTSGRETATLRGHGSRVRAVAFRRDGRFVATAEERGDVFVWDVPSLSVHMKAKANGPIPMLFFGQRLLAFGSFAGDVMVLDPDASSTVFETRGLEARGVALDSRESRVFATAKDGSVRVWELASGRQLHVLRGLADEPLHTELSPDDAEVVASGRDGTARVWNADTGELRASLRGHEGSVWKAYYNPTGTKIATVADDGQVRLWDRASGAVLAVLGGHSGLVIDAAFSPDGSRLATASYDGTAVVWRTDSSYRVAGWSGVVGEPCAMDQRLEGVLIAVACAEYTRVWDLRIPSLAVSLPGAERIALAGTRRIWTADSDAQVARAFELPGGSQVAERRAKAPITALAASQEDDRLVVGDRDGGIQLFEGEHPAKTLRESGDALGVIAVLPDSRILALDELGTIRLFERDGAALGVISGAPAGALELEVSPDGTSAIVIGGNNPDVAVVRLDGALRLDWLRGHQARAMTARFQPEHQRILTTSEDGTVGLWDSATGKLLHRFTGRIYFNDAMLDRSGQVVIALDGAGDLLYFDARTGDRLAFMAALGAPGLRLSPLADGMTVSALDYFGGLAVLRIPYDTTPTGQLRQELSCKAPQGVTNAACR